MHKTIWKALSNGRNDYRIERCEGRWSDTTEEWVGPAGWPIWGPVFDSREAACAYVTRKLGDEISRLQTAQRRFEGCTK
ncbi:MAG: hypothetical protein ACPG4T_08730 [Nannocystaceae bacterium]